MLLQTKSPLEETGVGSVAASHWLSCTRLSLAERLPGRSSCWSSIAENPFLLEMAGSLFLIWMIDMRGGEGELPLQAPHSDIMEVSLLVFEFLSSLEAHAGWPGASSAHLHTLPLSKLLSWENKRKLSSRGCPTVEGGRGDPWLALPTCGVTPRVLPPDPSRGAHGSGLSPSRPLMLCAFVSTIIQHGQQDPELGVGMRRT